MIGLFRAAMTAYDAARTSQRAVAAAREVLAAGGSLFAALDAFAASTDTPLDDDVVAALHRGVEAALDVTRTALGAAVTALTWADAHRDGIRQTCEATARLATAVPGYLDRLLGGAAGVTVALVKARVRLDALARRESGR